MEKTSILDLKIGKPDTTVTITSVEEIEVPVSGSMSKKILFKVKRTDGKEFNISDTWVTDAKGGTKIQGLWLTLDEDGNLAANSALAKFIKYHKLDSLGNAINKKVSTYPDLNNYLVFTACSINDIESRTSVKIPENETKANLFE